MIDPALVKSLVEGFGPTLAAIILIGYAVFLRQNPKAKKPDQPISVVSKKYETDSVEAMQGIASALNAISANIEKIERHLDIYLFHGKDR